MINKPEIVTEKHLEYLDDLRESGVTNMYGSGTYIERAFVIDRKQAGEIVQYWMDTFTERYNK